MLSRPSLSFLWRVAGLTLLLLLRIRAAGARIVTIDDVNGDELSHVVPVFAPVWNVGSTAHVALDTAQVFDKTWHDATAHPGDPKNVSFSFTGTTLDVFCIITNNPDPNGRFFDRFAKYNFILDGVPVGPEYRHEPENITDYFYNVSVFSTSQLENTNHDFTMALNTDEGPVLMLFDYAAYTKPDNEIVVTTPSSSQPPSSSSVGTETPQATTLPLSNSPTSTNSPTTDSSSSTTIATPDLSTSKKVNPIPAIVGGTFGGIALIALVVIFLLRRRQTSRRKETLPVTQPYPFLTSPPRPPSTDIYPQSHLRESTQYASSISASTAFVSDTTDDTEVLVSEINEIRGVVRDLVREQRALANYLDQPPLYQTYGEWRQVRPEYDIYHVE